MELEKRTKIINGIEKNFFRCIGNGQCSCKDCNPGWNRHWTELCYKLNENDDFVLCYNHLIKRLREE